MKSRQPAVWQTLASVRLSLALMAGIIGISVLASLIAQSRTSPVPLEKLYAPATLYFMKLAGLTDIFHSGWFIILLSALVVNLVFVAIDRLPGTWKLAAQEAPPAFGLEQLKKGKQTERFLHEEFKSSLPREDFRELVNAFAAERVGKPHTVRDEGGLSELQIAAQNGRFGRINAYIAHLALLVIILGGVIGAFKGFEGQLNLDEGARVGYIQVMRGNTRNWQLLREKGRVLPGFYQPGFEVELATFEVEYYPGTEKPKHYQSWVRFHEGGRIVGTQKVGVNQPIEFKGIRFYQSGFAKTTGAVGTVTVNDRQSKTTQTIPLAKDSTFKLEGATIRVLAVDEKVEELGPAMQIEYVEGNEAPRRFWVFQNFPRYDAVARKKARYSFTLDSTRPRFTSHLYVIEDPGAKWVWIGSALLVISIFFSLYRSHNRVWFVWTQKQAYIVGWSTKLFVFEPRFQRLAEQFKSRALKTEKSLEKSSDKAKG